MLIGVQEYFVTFFLLIVFLTIISIIKENIFGKSQNISEPELKWFIKYKLLNLASALLPSSPPGSLV